MSLTPKNWASFQHYKDRSPAWIKLHRGLLDDFAFSRLHVASRALAPLLWLLASEYEGGKITAPLDELAFRLHMSDEELRAALKPLIDGGFFIDDSNMLAECKQEAIPERERENKKETQDKTEEREPSLRSGALAVNVSRGTSDWPEDYHDEFWNAYPRKKAKKAAFKALDRIRRSGEVTFDRLMAGVKKIPIGEPVFIPHPATWLNAGRWDDEELPGERNGPGRHRSLQDDSLSVSRALERQQQNPIQFGPRPTLLPDDSPGDLRLLSPRRSA
jgi:hypothetical protein